MNERYDLGRKQVLLHIEGSTLTWKYQHRSVRALHAHGESLLDRVAEGVVGGRRACRIAAGSCHQEAEMYPTAAMAH